MSLKIKVVIADDHTLVTQSLSRCLESDKVIEVVGTAENGKVLIELIKKLKPDVVILDLNMPVMNGWETLEYLNEHNIDCKVIIMSTLLENASIKGLAEKGVRGFLPKNTDFETFVNAIYEVNNLGYFFDKKVNYNIVKELLALNTIQPTFEKVELDEKERETLIQICADNLTKQIAANMKVTDRSVERYKTRLYEKTKAKTSAGLLLFALKHRYISLD